MELIILIAWIAAGIITISRLNKRCGSKPIDIHEGAIVLMGWPAYAIMLLFID